MKNNDHVSVLTAYVFGKNSKTYDRRLEKYKIRTIEQLWFVLDSKIPEFNEKEIKGRALALSYNKASKVKNTDEKKIKTLKAILKVGKKEAVYALDSLKTVKYKHTSYSVSKKTLSFGAVLSKNVSRSKVWKSVKRINKQPDFYILPNYEKQMGIVFDQKNRGTCVANAATSLFDYITGEKTSRQFLYHQCKMIDGRKNSAGTFMKYPMVVLTDKTLVDYGTVFESVWEYNGNRGQTEHQGPPPEECFNTKRYIGHDFDVVSARTSSVVSDLKALLVGFDSHKPVPITVGLPLYESFINEYTSKTGIVSMPLPGESIAGYHAMIVVGYIEKDEYFIVRNSWGTAWAAENPHKLPGHALIPYDYFKKYLEPGNAITLRLLDSATMMIREEDRLCNKNTIRRVSQGKIAALAKKKKAKKK